MAQSKKMNEARFAKLTKELDSVGEVILTKQDEKQSVMDDFVKERNRYAKGRISEDTLISSSRKVNLELMRLDKGIREAIARVGKISTNAKEFASNQAPKVFRTSVSGIKLINGPKKKSTKKSTKKAVKRTVKKTAKKATAKKGVTASKTTLSKEKVLDRKYSK